MPSSCEPSSVVAIQPCLAEPYRIGKSSCSSVASSAANRSNTSLMTSTGRASERSTLLMTTMGFRPILQRLRHHEFGLRQRALGGVDQHQRAVDHIENALDLAAEIGVAGRIDDIDAGALPFHRSGLGQDGDAALALEVVGIHRAFDLALVLAIDAGLLQQPIDQRGLAVVDVGDDGDVAEVHSSSGSDNGRSAMCRKTGNPPRNPMRDRLFGSRSNLKRGDGAQKGSPAKRDRAHLTRCGAIYSENAKKQWLVSHLVSSFSGREALNCPFRDPGRRRAKPPRSGF